MEKVAVVILNYVNYKETIQCVESILPQEKVDFEIIIVDNGSSNESCRELRKKYRNHKLVHVLKSNKNYGFAKGNNIGIHYAKKRLSADFILLLNSDTELIQSDYISVLVSKYEENIGVISSRIIQKRGMIQESYYDYVKFPDTLFLYLQLVCDYFSFLNLSSIFNQLLKKAEKTEILHGSCLMLTPAFFKHYELLYSRTFLYSEEVLLYIYCQKAGLTQIKTEETAILHKGKQSSKYLYENRGSIRRKFQIASYKYVVLESFKIYLKDTLKAVTGG